MMTFLPFNLLRTRSFDSAEEKERAVAQQVQHTLYQVSTAAALVQGVYAGAVRVSTLRQHGDLGLGTFEGLDGEMVVADTAWSAKAC